MTPDTRSRNESNADVMMESDPLCNDANTCTAPKGGAYTGARSLTRPFRETPADFPLQ
jgi:hypothetical protein